MDTHNIATWVCSMWWCVKIQHYTHTCLTCLGNTVNLPLPVLHSSADPYSYVLYVATICSPAYIITVMVEFVSKNGADPYL